MQKIYACIDLKSFYASVECVLRNLDPLKTNLVVADISRTEKTICLAVSPSLKQYGLSGRARLFEVISKINLENEKRLEKLKIKKFINESYNKDILDKNANYKISYIVAAPNMEYYLKISAKIFEIYLKYISSEDIHVYSIDEVFMDITSYLKNSNKTAEKFVLDIIEDIYKTTGITATAGIGTNLYLAKIAMDIIAKKSKPDKNNVRIAFLDEQEYKNKLWNHMPLTDFWRIGKGTEKRLEKLKLYTMGDIARCSLGDFLDYHNQDLLFNEFGINAELLIDHAWGYENVTIKDIKKYIPKNTSISTGQVLSEPYNYEKTLLIIKEMIEILSLNLVKKGLKATNLNLVIGYDIINLKDEILKNKYDGKIITDYVGRKIPKASNGTIKLENYTSSTRILTFYIVKLFNQICNKDLLIRRINISANVINISNIIEKKIRAITLFDDYDNIKENDEDKQEKLQKTIIDLKNKYGKNSILKAMNLEEGSTTIKRNNEIGGHKK